MGTLNDMLKEQHRLEDEVKHLQDLCRQALHHMETPGDFSDDEVSALMADLQAAGYPATDEEEDT